MSVDAVVFCAGSPPEGVSGATSEGRVYLEVAGASETTIAFRP